MRCLGRVFVAFGTVGVLGAAPSYAGAQATNDLRIDIEALAVSIDGSFGSGANFGVPVSGPAGTYERSLSILSNGCIGGSAPYILNEAVAGWHVWVTPVATSGDAVTFRVLWERSPNGNTDAWNPGTEQTFTLKPGRIVPLDTISAPPQVSKDRTCSSSTLQVRVRHVPSPEQDRRLLSTDLVLVQRLANGTERTHPITVRGLFNENSRFLFDTIDDNGVLFEVQGEFTARPDTDGIAMEMVTTARVVEGDVVSYILRDGVMMRGRGVRSTLRLTPDQPTTVDLPRIADNDSGAFAQQSFSLRVRSRQIR